MPHLDLNPRPSATEGSSRGPRGLTGITHLLLGERGTGWRVLLTLGAFMGFLVYVEFRWERPWVGLEDGLRDPRKHAGSLVLHGPARVMEEDGEGFVVRTSRGMRVRVESERRLVRVGDEVVYWGTILPTGRLALLERDGRTFLRLSPGGIRKRVAMYGVSLGVLGYVVWRFRRNFVLRDGRFALRGGHG